MKRKIFFDLANPESPDSLTVRVIRGMMDLIRYYRKLGLKRQAKEQIAMMRSFAISARSL